MIQTTVDRPLRIYTSKLKAPRLRARRKSLAPTVLVFGFAFFLIALLVLGA
jgi:hypothetical protein